LAPLTYRDLTGLMDQAGEDLNALGFGRGDRIAVIGPNNPAIAALFLGIWDCATAVPLNPALSLGEFLIYLKDLKVQAVAVDSGIDTPARAAAQEIGLPILEIEHGDGPVTAKFDIRAESVSRTSSMQERPEIDDAALVLITSGTTTHSKIVPVSHRNFINKVRITVADMALTRADRCLNLMPMFHAGGLHGSLGGVFLTGGSLVFLPNFSAENFFHVVESLAPTWYTASSTFQHAIVAAAGNHNHALERSRIRFIRVGAGPLDPQIRNDLERLFRAPVMGAYASTETGQIAIDPLPPAVRKPGTAGRVAGLEVAIMGPENKPLGPGQRGEIVVNPTDIFGGYENDAAANAESFIAGWFRTGDEGMLDEDGYLTLTGRIKDIINRGGEKITPSEVEDAIKCHPDVAAAVIFPIPHATLGQEVAAAVVPEDGAILTEEMLSEFLRGRLAGFKLPRRIVITADIPKDPNGKVQRHALAQTFALEDAALSRAENRDADRRPTALEAKLQQIWMELLSLDDIGLNDDFFILGGDSLQAVDLFLRIEEEMGRRLPRSILFEAGTVAKMAERIEASVPSSCLVPIQPEGDRLPFFCIHDRNGEVLNYRQLARQMGDGQPFYGIQARGLDGEDPPFANIEDMAEYYIKEIKKVQPLGPYFLGGYSMGGHVALVMSQRLRAAGEEVAFLALLDSYSNSGQRRVGMGSWFAQHRARLKELPAPKLPSYLWLRAANLAGMITTSLFVRSFATGWRFFQTRGKPIPRILRRPVLANHMILRDYRPRPYEGDVTLFKAELYAWSHPMQHEGWRDIIRGKFEVRPVPGGHFDIMNLPHVQVLAAELSDALDSAQNAHRNRHGSRPKVLSTSS
ncbi:MAG: non-ribosomal peptide synthetase, partial [Alphaproteobacteria bacterium]|nr:non-ribosomal peptide synthetase [Alphaproteobacteria bacterium]